MRREYAEWYTCLLARVEGLPEPLRTYGLEQCSEAWQTFCGSSDWRIAWELSEIVESLEFTSIQIQHVTHGAAQEAYLLQLGYLLQFS